jgi:pSer/pThr/pTyr-binding forkhead associated (FHA) protein
MPVDESWVPGRMLRVEVHIGVTRREARFSAPVVTIGRGAPDQATPDIDLEQDDSVSRQHAEIRWTGNRLSLVDKNSTNGTWLNGEKLTPGQPRWLKDGDRIAVGRLSVLTVHLAGGQDAGPPP